MAQFGCPLGNVVFSDLAVLPQDFPCGPRGIAQHCNNGGIFKNIFKTFPSCLRPSQAALPATACAEGPKHVTGCVRPTWLQRDHIGGPSPLQHPCRITVILDVLQRGLGCQMCSF